MTDRAVDRFFIRKGYTPRTEPDYFLDACRETEGIVHQPDVYPFVAHLGQRFGVGHLIDIGCGRAEKLAEFRDNFELAGIDFADNLAWCRKTYGFGNWIAFDLESGEDLPLPSKMVADSVVVCSDVIEHLRDPTHLLRNLRKLSQICAAIVVTTPERDLARGPDDPGPPENRSHVREWNLTEFAKLLAWADLPPSFLGLTRNSDQSPSKKTILAVIDGLHPEAFPAPPEGFTVTAIMTTFNEGDIIESVVEHLIMQGIRVHLVDNWSIDDTIDRIRRFRDRGLITVEEYPPSGPSGTFDWEDLLRRVEEIAAASDSDWVIHHDADEIRRSPWPGTTLRNGLYRIEACGYNAVDHTVIEFWPVADVRVTNLEADLRHFQFGRRPGHFLQIRAWKPQAGPINLVSSGGHEAEFRGRRVFPYKFLTKHYPIRSQGHGERKVFRERMDRWNPDERDRGWHVQYDHFKPGDSFLKSRKELEVFVESDFNSRCVVERLSGLNVPRTEPGG